LTGSRVEIPTPTLEMVEAEGLIAPEILQSARTNFKIDRPTYIQACSIPNILQRRNFVGIAPTGTGKTLSYLLPVAEILRQSKHGRCLIVAPTFELSVQIYKVCLQLIGKKKPLLGLSIGHIQKLQEGEIERVRVLVSTPQTFLKSSEKPEFAKFVKELELVVLDEADKFFELSFLPQLEQLLSLFKTADKQYVLMSATFPHEIEKAIEGSFVDRTQAVIGGKVNVLSTIDQQLTYCSTEEGKLYELERIINEGQLKVPCVVFMQSKERVKEIYRVCKRLNIRADYLHNDMSLKEREKKVKEFAAGKIWMLITSDLLARGMDFPDLKLVINFDIPLTTVTYVHRVGRTGRAGAKGTAITFFTNEDKPILRKLADLLKQSGCPVPGWMFEISKPTKQDLQRAGKELRHRDSLYPPRRDRPDDGFRAEIRKRDYEFYKKAKENGEMVEEEAEEEQAQEAENGNESE
jgi:ATP-dependent RNA helicase DDX52/ROK1